MKELSPNQAAKVFKSAVSKATCDQLVAELLPLVGNARNYRKEALTTLICEHFPAIGYREARALSAEELVPLLSRIREKVNTPRPVPDSPRSAPVQVLLDVADAEVLRLAADENLSGEERMIAILRIDRRYEAKRSTWWSELLGVKDATIRGYETWKLMQAGRRSPDP